MSGKLPVGIDFGTSNSMIAVYKGKGLIDIISTDSGKRFLPSVIYFKNENEAVTGDSAKGMQLIESDKTIANIKRYMGTDRAFHLFGVDYRPEELASIIFKKLMHMYSDYTSDKKPEAVITVPAYFDHYQREAVRAAAECAGFHVLRLLNEPTSAALFYNNIGKKENELCMVFDLGGGTLDISLIKMNKKSSKVIATGGSTEIGGIDYDIMIADYFIDCFRKEHGIDLKSDPIAYQQLLFQAEKSKIELSSLNEVNMVVPYITIQNGKPLHFKETLSRETFERVTKPITDMIESIVNKLLVVNGIKTEDISRVLPVGGASRIHTVRKLLDNYYGNILKKDLNPEEAVVSGAAIHCAMLLKDADNKEFMDVTSHNLGIEDNEGKFEVILEKNESFPIKFSKMFTLSDVDRKSITVHVLQDMAKSYLNNAESIEENPDCFVSLAKFDMNVTYSEDDDPLIEITFLIDESGIVSVEAVDVSSGNKKDIVLKLKADAEKINKLEIY